MAEIDRVFWEKAQENLEAAPSEFVNRRKLYPANLRTTLTQNDILRERADYTTDHVNEARAAGTVERTDEFLGAIRPQGGDPG